MPSKVGHQHKNMQQSTRFEEPYRRQMISSRMFQIPDSQWLTEEEKPGRESVQKGAGRPVLLPKTGWLSTLQLIQVEALCLKIISVNLRWIEASKPQSLSTSNSVSFWKLENQVKNSVSFIRISAFINLGSCMSSRTTVSYIPRACGKTFKSF